jgi:hypothetical protein
MQRILSLVIPAQASFAVIPGPGQPEPGIYPYRTTRHLVDNRPLLRPALRAIGFADVRSGILPPQS